MFEARGVANFGSLYRLDIMSHVQKPISKQLKAQKPKPPLCHILPANYTSVSDAAGIMERIFDELQVRSLSHVAIAIPRLISESCDLGLRNCRLNHGSSSRD